MMLQKVKHFYRLQRSLLKSALWKWKSPRQREQVVEASYERRFGKKLDWDHLETFTEKMQWAKLYDVDQRKILCSDKYLVRDWVEKRIGAQYLIPLLGVYDRFSDIDFDRLPNQFVIKTNHGSGDVYVVRDKAAMTSKEKRRMRNTIAYGMKLNLSSRSGEAHYEKIKPKIIVEALIGSDDEALRDYKFLCFDGVPYFVWVDIDRYGNHKRNMYNMNWELQSWNQNIFPNTDEPLPPPPSFEEMVEVARRLSEGFSHVRVDLYNLDGKIYFGEMTFTGAAGLNPIVPESANLMLGNLWNLDTSVKRDWDKQEDSL